MVQAILVWTGAVLALGLLLVMALGPVIVEIDAWRYERRHNKRRTAAASVASKTSTASAAQASSAAPKAVSSVAPAQAPVPRHAA